MKYIYIGPGGFTMPYTLGICQFIKEHYNIKNYNYIGTSAGAWSSVYLASDFIFTEKQINKYSKEFDNSNIIYKWTKIYPYLTELFLENIDDLNFIYKKKIEISISEYSNKNFKNILTNDYNNIQELLELCYYSSYIPFLSGNIYDNSNNNKYKRNKIIKFDGAFTKPNFEKRNIILNIENSMFNRSFSFNDVLGKNNHNTLDLINLGYYDSMIHKDYLDIILK